MPPRAESRSINEIRRREIEALAEALGPVDAVRFLQSFDTGKGDYTEERGKWLDQSLEDIISDIK
jgi:LmbE family N-acetylglucosaminyl deacetylase